MSKENVHERKKKPRFTFIVVPDTESKQPRTFSISRWKLAASLVAVFFGIVALIIVVLIFTPARRLLPVSGSDLGQRYGKQIAAIQDQVSGLIQEMTVLRSYNLRLRKALGEQIPPHDTSLSASSSAANGSGMKPEESQGEQVSAERSVRIPAEAVEHARGDVHGTPVLVDQQVNDKAVTREFPLTMPVEGYVSRGFDAGQYHYGIDFVNKVSTPVLAAADGNVVFAGWTYDDGMMMMIAHGLGYITVYKHNKALLKDTSAPVKRGEVISLLGNTGKTSSGPHLHFEVWKDGIPYDPVNYLLTTQ